MKKITAIFLFLLYGAASSGATLHFHYCMGKLQAVDLVSKSSDRCDNCGMTTAENPCCKDVHKTIKAQKDYQPSGVSFSLPAVPAIANNFSIFESRQFPVSQAVPAVSDNGPPGSIPLFVQYRNFRI